MNRINSLDYDVPQFQERRNPYINIYKGVIRGIKTKDLSSTRDFIEQSKRFTDEQFERFAKNRIPFEQFEIDAIKQRVDKVVELCRVEKWDEAYRLWTEYEVKARKHEDNKQVQGSKRATQRGK